MSEPKTVRLDHLLGVYRVGSGDWSWQEEYDLLIYRPDTQKTLESIRVEGIREPIVLGNDGRVWDGHHRIVIAMFLGLDSVPVEFAGSVVPEEPDWEFCIAYPNTAGGRTVWNTDGIDPFESEDDARQELESGDYLESDRVVRRRKAGDWESVPVEQKGETDD